MDTIDEKYALLGLTEDSRTKLSQLAKLASPPSANQRRIVVETVVIREGDRVVVGREEHSG